MPKGMRVQVPPRALLSKVDRLLLTMPVLQGAKVDRLLLKTMPKESPKALDRYQAAKPQFFNALRTTPSTTN
jgi:hypothetical protein